MGTDARQFANGSDATTTFHTFVPSDRKALRRQLARDGAVVLVLAFMAGFNFGLILRARH